MSLQFSIMNEAAVSVVSIQGRILSDLDLEQLKEKIEQIKFSKFVFDLSELTNTNSSGIAFMIRTMTKARINGGDVVLANPNSGIQKLIDISKLYEVFSIYKTTEEAINHFNK
ncbi:MAG: STAS domain-containing protein [Bacteroidetes bacterium]|nr:STAS domain-containing protein [Bacteroidota bacterium]